MDAHSQSHPIYKRACSPPPISLESRQTQTHTHTHIWVRARQKVQNKSILNNLFLSPAHLLVVCSSTSLACMCFSLSLSLAVYSSQISALACFRHNLASSSSTTTHLHACALELSSSVPHPRDSRLPREQLVWLTADAWILSNRAYSAALNNNGERAPLGHD